MTTPVKAQSHSANRYRIRMPYAIGDVAEDVNAAAEAVSARISDKGAHLVLVCPTGSVYVVLAYEVKAEILAEKYPTWIAGWFDYAASTEDLADDLRETYRQVRKMAWVPA